MCGIPASDSRFRIGLQHHRLGRVGLAHHHRGIDAGQDIQRLAQKFDGAGTVEEGEILAQIAGGQDIHLHAHLAGARFRRGIAQAGAGRAPSLCAAPRR